MKAKYRIVKVSNEFGDTYRVLEKTFLFWHRLPHSLRYHDAVYYVNNKTLFEAEMELRSWLQGIESAQAALIANERRRKAHKESTVTIIKEVTRR
jgi:hypothetical protein